MTDLNQMLAEAQANTTQNETLARQLEAEIKKIPGTAGQLPKRRYGQPVDPAAINNNMTLNGLINVHRPDIAAFLGISNGLAQQREGEAEARKLQAERMKMQTEQLRQNNQAAKLHRERAAMAGINPITNRRMGQ